MRFPILLLAAIAISAQAPAHAGKIRASDTGGVGLIHKGELPEGSVTIKSGDVLWSEIFEPEKVKVLVDDVTKRIRPNVSGVAAGTTLIGVDIASGTAYCPLIDFDAPVARVQCFQDINADGIFDGGYYTDQRGFDTQFLAGWVRGLSGLTQKPAYRDVSEGTIIPTGSLTVQFDRIRNNTPEFWIFVEKERASDRSKCDIPEPGVCNILGRQYQFLQNEDDSLTFTAIGQTDSRGMNFYSVSSYRKR